MINFHGGFIKQYKSVLEMVNQTFDKYVNDKRFNKITICGHSLGAALALDTYIFQSLRNPQYKNFSCWVAGTPKVGNSFLWKFIKESSLLDKCHIMNIKSDLVKCAPPNSLGFIDNPTDVEIEPIRAPFKTKFDHTLFYYLYCIKNKAPVKVINR